MEIARALVLATETANEPPWSNFGIGPKPLVPIATKPILFHALDAVRSAGVLEVTLFSDAFSAAAFRDALGDGARWDMTIGHASCEAPLDVRGALRAAAEFVGDEPVLLTRGDAILRDGLRDHIVGFAGGELDALALVLAPQRPQRGLPSEPGAYLLSPAAVAAITREPDGQQTLAGLRARGLRVASVDAEGCLACHGGEASLLEANRVALGRLTSSVGEASLQGCEIQGPVQIHPTATLANTLVRGPAIVGAGSRVVDSYLGPYTSIGADVRVEGTEIEHSIVMDGAQLLFVGSRLDASIIGRGASIVRRFDMPSAVRMSIGDGAEVALS